MNKTSYRHEQGEATPVALLFLLLVLGSAWLLWSGIYKPMILALGVLSCLLTLWLGIRMGFFDDSSHLARIMPRLPGFWFWLVRDILKSSWEVARLVLSKDLQLDPTLVRIKSSGQLEISQTILANSITLSPGTVTLDVYEGEVLVHCLTRNSAESLTDVNSRVAALEKPS